MKGPLMVAFREVTSVPCYCISELLRFNLVFPFQICFLPPSTCFINVPSEELITEVVLKSLLCVETDESC
jgi:hypothetical protein